jgi:hypothetical protein
MNVFNKLLTGLEILILMISEILGTFNVVT